MEQVESRSVWQLTKWTLFIILTIMGFVIAFVVYSTWSKSEKTIICETKLCNYIASRLQKLNPNVEPCANFYQFVACDSEAYPDHINRLKNETLMRLHNILEEPINSTDAIWIRHIKAFYHSCLKSTHGFIQLQEIMSGLGRWPMIDGPHWNSSEFDWKNIANKCKKLGCSAHSFIHVDVERCLFPDNIEKFIIVFNNPDPNRELSDKSYSQIISIFDHFDVQNEYFYHELHSTLDFARSLINITSNYSVNKTCAELFMEAKNNSMTIDELTNNYPTVTWKDHVDINKNETVFVANPEYMRQLESLFNRTSKRVQANYIMYTVLLNIYDFVGYTSSIMGSSKALQCVSKTLYFLPHAVNRLYERKFINKKSSMHFNEMQISLKNQLQSSIQKVDWIDDVLHQQLLEQVNAIPVGINSTCVKFDEIILHQHLNEKLNFYPDNFLKYILQINSIFPHHSNKMVNQNHCWDSNINLLPQPYGIHNPQPGDVVIPPKLLHNAIYEDSQPKYFYYAYLGPYIVHEMISKYCPLCDVLIQPHDCIKNLLKHDRSRTWVKWKSKIIIELHLSYLAYKDWLARNETESNLHESSYTNEQIFWIITARVICARDRLGIAVDNAGYNFELTIMLFKYVTEFSKAFGCLNQLSMISQRCFL